MRRINIINKNPSYYINKVKNPKRIFCFAFILIFALSILSYASLFDSRLPQVEIVSPLNNSTVFGDVKIEVNAKAYHEIYEVKLSINDDTPYQMEKINGNSHQGTYIHVWNTRGIPDGKYELDIQLLDTFGHTQQQQITVFVANTFVYTYGSIAQDSSNELKTDSNRYYYLSLDQILENDFIVETEEIEETFEVVVEKTERNENNVLISGKLSFNNPIPDVFWFNVTGDIGQLLCYEFTPELPEDAVLQIIEDDDQPLNIQLDGNEINKTETYLFELAFEKDDNFNGKIKVGTGTTVVKVSEVSVSPTIDGNVTPSEWNTAFKASSGWENDTGGAPPFELTAYIMHNQTYVFVAFNVSDPTTYNDEGNPPNWDYAVVYFDVKNDGPPPPIVGDPAIDDRGYGVNRDLTLPNGDPGERHGIGTSTDGQLWSGVPPSGWNYGFYNEPTTNSSWSIEFEIPFSVLGISSSQDVIGIKFLYGDSATPGTPKTEYFWPAGGGGGGLDPNDDTASYGDAYLDPDGPIVWNVTASPGQGVSGTFFDFTANVSSQTGVIDEVTIQIRKNDTTAEDTIQLSNGGGNDIWTGSWNSEGYSAGEYHVTVIANSTTTVNNMTLVEIITIDTIPPTLNWNDTNNFANNTWWSDQVTIDVEASDPGGLDTVWYRIYNVSSSDYVPNHNNETLDDPGFTTNIDTSTWHSADIYYRVDVFANDSSDNEAQLIGVDARFFRIDKTPPTIVLESPTNDTDHNDVINFDFTITDTDGVGVHKIWYYWDSDPTIIPDDDGDFSYDSNLLVDGWRWLYIYANDTLGNEHSEKYRFRIDNTPPDITFNEGLDTPADGNDPFTIQFTVTDDLVGVDTVTLYYDPTDDFASFDGWQSMALTPIGGNIYSGTLSRSTVGRWAFRYYLWASDNKGNVRIDDNGGSYYNYLFDVTAPTISNTQNGPNGDDPNTIQTHVTDAGCGVDTNKVKFHYWLSTDNSTWGAEEPPIPLNDMGGGDFAYNLWYVDPNLFVRYYIIANDTLDNERPDDNYGDYYFFTFDSDAPEITLNSPLENVLIKPPSVEATTIDLSIIDPNDVDYAKYKWNDGGWVKLESPYNIPIIQDMYDDYLVHGTNTLTIWANDTLNNYQEVQFNFEVDKTAPIITLNSPTNDTYQTSGTIVDIGVSDTYFYTVLYNWDGTANSTGSVSFTTTIPSGDGLHVLYLYANDTSDNGQFAKFSFTTDDTAPIISLVAPSNESSVEVGSTIDLDISDDVGIHVVLYNWNGGSNATLIDPWNVAVPSALTTHILYIYANDTFGHTTSVQYLFTVVSKNDNGGGSGGSGGDGDGGDGGSDGGSKTTTKTMLLTLLTEIPSAVTKGTTVTVRFSLTDSSGDGIEGASVSLTIGNNSMTCTDLGKGIYTCSIDTSSLSPGAYNFTITASKTGYEKATSTQSVTINEPLPLMLIGAGGVIAAGVIIGVILVLKNAGIIFSKNLAASYYKKTHLKV